MYSHTVRPFSAETSPPRTLHWPRTVTPVTWPGGWRGAALLVVLQDNSQAHRVGRQHRVAEVHASQALGLPVRAPPRGPRAVPPRCVPLWAFSPGSQHNVNDALLVQVTALCEGDRITTRMSRRYTADGAEPQSILQSTKDIGLCPSARSPGAQSCPALATPRTIALEAPLPMEFSRPRILEWVAIPFPRGSSGPRSECWTQVFCIAGRFLTIWATNEAPGS